MTSLLVLGLMRSRGLDASIGAGGPFVVRPRKHTLAEQMFLVASEDARVLADNNGCRPSGPPGPDPRGQTTGARPMHRSVGKVAFIRFQPQPLCGPSTALAVIGHPGPATRVPRTSTLCNEISYLDLAGLHGSTDTGISFCQQTPRLLIWGSLVCGHPDRSSRCRVVGVL